MKPGWRLQQKAALLAGGILTVCPHRLFSRRYFNLCIARWPGTKNCDTTDSGQRRRPEPSSSFLLRQWRPKHRPTVPSIRRCSKMALASRPVSESQYGMSGSPRGYCRMVLPGQYLPEMEILRFPLMGPRETYVCFSATAARVLRASPFTAGSGKSVLWLVISLPVQSKGIDVVAQLCNH
jgi:hypothetical protein